MAFHPGMDALSPAGISRANISGFPTSQVVLVAFFLRGWTVFIPCSYKSANNSELSMSYEVNSGVFPPGMERLCPLLVL